MAETLVTGGAGFLGRCVVSDLRDGGDHVVSLDVEDDKAGVDWVAADLTAGPPVFSEPAPNTVFHLAGLAHVAPRNAVTSRQFFRVNVQGTRNLLLGLEAGREVPQGFVFVSTVAVYGLEEGIDLDEETPRIANDPYGESKRQAEDLVLEWGEQKGVRVAIVRLPLVAGPGAPGNLGAMVSALRQGRYLGVGGGEARHSIVLARDVASILPRVAEVGGIFHLTDGHHPSFRELEGALCTAIGRPEPRRLPFPAAKALGFVGDAVSALGVPFPFTSGSFRKMTSTQTFSDDKARRELGWQPGRVVDAAAEIVA